MQVLSGEGPELGTEHFLYEASLPGPDEELFFRGLLLALWTQAFGEGRLIAGARIGIAEFLITFIFGGMHGLVISNGHFVVDRNALIGATTIGICLVWLRRRTDSLVLPMIAHDAVNVASSFF